MNKTIWAALIIAVLIIIGFFVFRGHDAPMAAAPGTDMDTIPAATSTAAMVDKFTVSGGNYYFTPKTLTVKKGDTVEITFVNAGGMHDFKIDEFKVATPRIASGATSVVTFVANKAGTFEYYCSVGNHRQMGMKGTLTVTE